jgi:hypothetical protein
MMNGEGAAITIINKQKKVGRSYSEQDKSEKYVEKFSHKSRDHLQNICQDWMLIIK